MKLRSINIDPKTIKVLNNHALIRFVDDDTSKSELIEVVKLLNSSKLRSSHVGEVINCRDYAEGVGGTKYSLEELQVPGTYVAYNHQSSKIKISWEGEIYNIIRVEDIVGIISNYKEV